MDHRRTAVAGGTAQAPGGTAACAGPDVFGRHHLRAPVRDRLVEVLLDRLGRADQIDWERASIDSASIPAKKGASRPARIQQIAVNRARSAILWSTDAASP